MDEIHAPAGTAFLGHPKGRFFLALTELWERFSYYGMTALLALYMASQLLLPGHVEHIVGFAGLRAVLESMSGPLSTQALASQCSGSTPDSFTSPRSSAVSLPTAGSDSATLS